MYHAQMPETQNETNRVELSSCTLPIFKKRAAKTFYNGDQRISFEKSARGSDQHPESTGSSGVNSDLEECFLWRCVQIDVHIYIE